MSEYDIKLQKLGRALSEHDSTGIWVATILDMVIEIAREARIEEQFEQIPMPEPHEISQSYCIKLVDHRTYRLDTLRRGEE